jgi:hypothetical protein
MKTSVQHVATGEIVAPAVGKYNSRSRSVWVSLNLSSRPISRYAELAKHLAWSVPEAVSRPEARARFFKTKAREDDAKRRRAQTDS